MLTINPSTPSFLTVACCGIFLIAVALWFNYRSEIIWFLSGLIFRSVPPKRKLTQTPAQAYSKMVHAIADATAPKDLDKLTGMIAGFRVEFTGYLREDEITDYIYDVNCMRKEKRFQLLRGLRDQQLQAV
jgi:hypothetical protein